MDYSPENYQIKEKLKKYKVLNILINKLRPPGSKSGNIGKKNREEFSRIIKKTGFKEPIIDIGSGPVEDGNTNGLSEEILKKRISFDYGLHLGTCLVADVNNLPFKNDSVSGVLFQGVIEHIENPERAILEINRVLKNNGLIYAEAPFLQHLHYDPIDHCRFTLDGLAHIFRDFKNIDSGVLYGPSAVMVDVLTEYFAVFFKSQILYWGVKWVLGWFLFPIKYLDIFFIKKPRSKFLCLGVYFLGRKRG